MLDLLLPFRRVITYLNYRVMVHERNSFDARFFKDHQLSDELTNELKVSRSCQHTAIRTECHSTISPFMIVGTHAK